MGFSIASTWGWWRLRWLNSFSSLFSLLSHQFLPSSVTPALSTVDETALHLMDMASTQMPSSALWHLLLDEAAWSARAHRPPPCCLCAHTPPPLKSPRASDNTVLEEVAPFVWAIVRTHQLPEDWWQVNIEAGSLPSKLRRNEVCCQEKHLGWLTLSHAEAPGGSRKWQQWVTPCCKGWTHPSANLICRLEKFAACQLRAYG